MPFLSSIAAHLNGSSHTGDLGKTDMTPTLRVRGLIKAVAIVLSLALPATLAISSADARVGGGSSRVSADCRRSSASSCRSR
jgi:hypothetical protein